MFLVLKVMVWPPRHAQHPGPPEDGRPADIS
jgi:hypothetical protein